MIKMKGGYLETAIDKQYTSDVYDSEDKATQKLRELEIELIGYALKSNFLTTEDKLGYIKSMMYMYEVVKKSVK
jgi:hypothetical protein